jgi:hypothetical protein
MTGRTLRELAEAKDHLMRGARYDWLESYANSELGTLAMIAEDADRMVRDCLAKLDELREG